MDIEKILRWIIVAIVLLVALVLLKVILDIGWALISISLKILLFLLLVAIVLRFFDVLRGKRRL